MHVYYNGVVSDSDKGGHSRIIQKGILFKDKIFTWVNPYFHSIVF